MIGRIFWATVWILVFSAGTLGAIGASLSSPDFWWAKALVAVYLGLTGIIGALIILLKPAQRKPDSKPPASHSNRAKK